uniref:Uncharacterized protein n=1 Tax=Romanomermis culicivorax TaxID=13658 RepID=A0A915JFM4_ROMCU
MPFSNVQKTEYFFCFRYIFLPLFLLVVLGLWNGLTLLPVILSLVGPDSEVDFIYQISNVQDGAVLVDSSKGSVKNTHSKNAC